MKYIYVLIAAAFLVFMVPSFKLMWDSWIPGLIEATPGLTVFLTALLTYFPWLLPPLIIIAIFLVIKGRSGT